MSDTKPRTLDAIASFRDHPDAIVQAGEVVEMRFPAGGSMSLRAGKLFHLLIQFAGVRVADAEQHKVTLSALNETFHVTAGELMDLVDELHTTTLRMHLTDAKGRRFQKSGPILSDAEQEDEAETQAELRYEFSPAMRRAIANSTHWAVVSRRAVLAFESRYALRLYTLLSLKVGLRKASEPLSVEDLRELLGVPAGKLKRWQDLRRKALEPALAEVNHLTGLIAGYVPIKRGRRITGITLTWGTKAGPDMVEAMKEIERPKVGRKARREGTVEVVESSDDQARRDLADALAAAGHINVKRDI
jgi:hypothetical protein